MQMRHCFVNSVNKRKIHPVSASQSEHSLLFCLVFSFLGVLNILIRCSPAAVMEYKPKIQYMLIVAELSPPACIDMDTHVHTQLIK